MTADRIVNWFMEPTRRWIHLRRVPMRHLSYLMLAVFLLFSSIGFYVDIMNGGKLPYATVILFGIVSGVNSALWILALSRLPRFLLWLLVVLQFFIGPIDNLASRILENTFHALPVDGVVGVRFSATATLTVVILSYVFFTRYMGITGKEAYRIKTELELAHTIQKTLVPPITRSTRCFEIYGISEPSEKVGGDLVDVVELPGGDTVAYLADIAGHGLQAGILMGMLKTAARTALSDEDGNDGGKTLSLLMVRLNEVLPQVKEAHMYATFTALRLNLDGRSFYGMAASPPLVLWSAANKSIVHVEEEQFPLGLLPVADFPASVFGMEQGDVVLIATDGILEVGSKQKADKDVEFGIEALERVLSSNANLPLPELAAQVLSTVRSYGRQLDDQTLLLVRRRAV